MCCFITTLLLLGPRIAAIIWWLLPNTKWDSVFTGSIIWPILGIIFVPWTALMWVILNPVAGFWDWLLIILAVIIDLGSSGGGFFGNRDRLGV